MDLFLLMTIVGCFLSLLLILVGGFWSLRSFPDVLAEIGRYDGAALARRARVIFPGSLVGGGIFLATFLSYRRYHCLAFPK
jgi:hypothetical protein